MSEVNFTHFSSIEHFPPCSSSPVSQSKQNLDVKDLHEAVFKETYLSYTIKATGKWRSKGAWMRDLCSCGSVCLATFCNKKIASPATFTDLRTTQILNAEHRESSKQMNKKMHVKHGAQGLACSKHSINVHCGGSHSCHNFYGFLPLPLCPSSSSLSSSSTSNLAARSHFVLQFCYQEWMNIKSNYIFSNNSRAFDE